MFQSVTLVGHVGSDPELRFVPSGKAVCNFSLATNEKRFDQEGVATENTTWWRITVWGKTAENVAQYATKGSTMLIEGRMKPDPTGNPRQFQKKDGAWASNYELTAFVARVLDKKAISELSDADLSYDDMPF